MKELIHGWRRKTGCITLVMALMLWCVWVRSIWTTDFIAFPLRTFGIGFFAIRSQQGEIGWQDLSMFSNYVPYGWSSHQFTAQQQAFEEFRLAFVTLPYWRLTIPLTLVSAYLILWKPPKRSVPNSLVSTSDLTSSQGSESVP